MPELNRGDPDASLGPDVAPLARIRALALSLPASDRRVAETILRWDEEVLGHSITELAEAAGVAESTVVRASKRLGFTGFQGLKLAIATDRRPRSELIADEISASDRSAEIIGKVFAGSQRVLADSASTVSIRSFDAVAEAIVAASRMLLVGVGPSSPIALDAAYRFRSLGVRVDAPVDALTQHLAAAQLNPADVCIAVSHTGATRETLASVQAAGGARAVTAAITSFAQSPLTKAVDFALIAGGGRMGFRVEAMASRFAHLAVIDALYVAVAIRLGPDAEDALALHHRVAADHQM